MFVWRITIILWVLAVCGVWIGITRYEFATSSDSTLIAVSQWPAGTAFNLADDRPTLLFFLHPRCPCSRASVRELERTLTGSGLSRKNQPQCIVIVSVPPDPTNEWRNTETVRRASAFPRTQVAWDVSGVESKRFGIHTSGTVLLFQPDGKRVFAGGVTVSRGHEGDSVGSDYLYSLLNQQSHVNHVDIPVFGCRLCLESEAPLCSEAQTDCPQTGVSDLQGAAL